MTQIERKKGNTPKYFDYSLLFVLLFLVVFGLVMVYSTSSYRASISFDGDGLYYLRKQIISTLVGLVVMVVASFFPYKFYYPIAFVVYVLSMGSLFLLLTPLGYSANGATRWLRISGFSMQPAEFVKIGVIFMTAYVISYFRDKEINKNSFKYVAIVLAPGFFAAIGVYLISDNLSSAIIIAGISYMLLVISTPKSYLAYGIFAALLIVGIAGVILLYIKAAGSDSVSSVNFRIERILAWFNPEKYADGKGYQTLQSLYSIGSGGIWGKGLGKSMQKLGFLPEAYNDMIFSVICEELGLFGGIAVIFLFLLLLYRLFDISCYIRSFFGNLLITGVFAHIAIQVVLNVAVVTNTIPNTGISLPFISYGGSSIIFLLAEMGVVMNVAKEADFTKNNRKRRKKKRPAATEE